MNAHFERDSIHPFTVEPASGWGNDNTTGKWVISRVTDGTHVIRNADGKDYTTTKVRSEATQFDDASVATIAAVKLKANTVVAVVD